jgi:hypothetical protein
VLFYRVARSFFIMVCDMDVTVMVGVQAALLLTLLGGDRYLLVQLAPFFREEWPIIRIPTCKNKTSVIGGVKVLQ